MKLRHALIPLALLLAGCGGDVGSNEKSSLSLFFSDEFEFSASTFALASFDEMEGSLDDGLNVFVRSGSRTLEIDLPSGSTTSLDADLRASVFYHNAFGEAEGVAGTITVVTSSDDEIGLRLTDVLLLDEDGEGQATLDGPITVRNVVSSRGGRETHPRRLKSATPAR